MQRMKRISGKDRRRGEIHRMDKMKKQGCGG
jgi:hypothetical protein